MDTIRDATRNYNPRAPIDSGATYSEVESILHLAMTAPTGDNSQHWRFTWNDRSLAIFYLDELGRHALNNNQHSVWLSLGCLVEAIKIGASGYRLELEEKFDFEDSWHRPVAIIRFQRRSVFTDPLIPEILRRRTTRVPFLSQPLDEMTIKLIEAEEKKFTNCKVAVRNGPPQELYSFFERCDEFMWLNSRVARDFLNWTRLSDAEVKKHFDGLSWFSLGLKKWELIPVRLIRSVPFLIPILWRLGFKNKVNQNTKQLISSCGATYCISISQNSPKAIVQAGRLAYRLWLNLGASGYGVQPLSLSSLTAFDVVCGYPPQNTTPKEIQFFRVGYEKVKKYYGLDNDDFPIWTFRAGIPKNTVFGPSTKRMPILDRLKVYTRSQNVD